MRSHAKKLRKKQQQFSIDLQGASKNTSLSIDKSIRPITPSQEEAFKAWENDYNIVLHGIAGTGKTFLGLYFSLRNVFDLNKPYHKVNIVRSIVPTRQVGHLPGSKKQKEEVYEEPYIPLCNEMFGRGDAYGILKQKDIVEFHSTSFLRGKTFDNCIVLVDEIQNMSDTELHTVMTRIGENSKIIFAGDMKQDDLTSKRYNEESGLSDFLRIMERMEEFKLIDFTIGDIVRSSLVKSYIINRYQLNL